jgi:hypothetical protein
MPVPPAPSVRPSDESAPVLTRTFVQILIVEAVTLLALYGFGRYFG